MRACTKKRGEASRLAYLGHVLMDNRHELITGEMVTAADGTAEVDAAVRMVDDLAGRNGSPWVPIRAMIAANSSRISGTET